jgi:hypothetical protein
MPVIGTRMSHMKVTHPTDAMGYRAARCDCVHRSQLLQTSTCPPAILGRFFWAASVYISSCCPAPNSNRCAAWTMLRGLQGPAINPKSAPRHQLLARCCTMRNPQKRREAGTAHLLGSHAAYSSPPSAGRGPCAAGGCKKRPLQARLLLLKPMLAGTCCAAASPPAQQRQCDQGQWDTHHMCCHMHQTSSSTWTSSRSKR